MHQGMFVQINLLGTRNSVHARMTKGQDMPPRRSLHRRPLALPRLLVCIIIIITLMDSMSTVANAETIPPFRNGVPGSGYGCDRKCGGGGGGDDDTEGSRGDQHAVHYVIRASLQTYPLHLPRPTTTTKAHSVYNNNNREQGVGGGILNISMFTRTFEGVAEER
jgi:hypothetical protein